MNKKRFGFLKVNKINFNSDKKAELLVQNIVFLILNLLFLSILIIFIFRQSSNAISLEESYAKNIALLIDSAKPDMIIKLNMEKGMKLAEKNNIDFDDAVKINDNIVTVMFSDESGYSYSFFNDVDVQEYPDEDFGIHVFTISEAKNE